MSEGKCLFCGCEVSAVQLATGVAISCGNCDARGPIKGTAEEAWRAHSSCVTEPRVKRLILALEQIDDACCRSAGGSCGPDPEEPEPIPPDPFEIVSICRAALAELTKDENLGTGKKGGQS
jgi:hypothetical protein